MITHPEKLIFPDDGITKGELAAYYALVAPKMLPHIRGRPMTMERFPQGIGEKGFFQKDVSRGFPAWLARVEVPKRGGSLHHPLIDDARALEWMANQNCVTAHVWNRRVPDLATPDLCVFDLDPPDAGEPEVLREMTLALRDLLAERGIASWVKTTGSKGFHVVVPVAGVSGGEVSRFCHATGAELVARHPAHLTQAFAKADRGGRIYVDTGRNEYSATYAAPYTVRARPGAPVSAPCTWEEVERGIATPRAFTLRGMEARLAAAGDPWADLGAAPATLR